MYSVEIDFSPAYELVISLAAFLDRRATVHRDLGKDWIARIRSSLQPTFAEALYSLREVPGKSAIDLLIWQCPTKHTAGDFLRWFAALSVGRIYEHILPYVPPGAHWLPRDLESFQGQVLTLLTHWDEQYFRYLDPRVFEGLASDAAARRIQLEGGPPDAVIETATNGISLEALPDLDRVILIPQYHFVPWNLTNSYYRMRLFQYAVDAVAPESGTPSPRLLRRTQCLADPMRLRILRFLASGPQSFSAIVVWADIPKSTVHYHLIALRAAGLVSIHDRGRRNDTFSLRSAGVAEVSRDLEAFLCGPDVGEETESSGDAI